MIYARKNLGDDLFKDIETVKYAPDAIFTYNIDKPEKQKNTIGISVIMICSRFHAMILSAICKQKMFVISYSKKIDNVIRDLEFSIETLNFNELKENTLIKLEQFKQTQNIEHIREASQNQFKKIDEYFS